MKKLLFILAVTVSLVANSQNTITKSVGEFTKLKAFDLIDVELIKSDVNKVEISGKNKEDVTIINKNDVLKIRMDLSETFNGHNTYVKVYFTNLEIIDANEGAFISSEDVFKQIDLTLKTQEGAQIKLQTNVTILDIKAITGGEIKTFGTAKKQLIDLSTGGIYNGKELESQDTEVTIKAGGEARVKAQENLDIKIRAGGEVIVYGKPKNVNESKALGGSIEYRN
ncbi:head GIN domain-containing protein [Mangrovimonas spongiae]|uniref:DUF2807 domain-containing protein n=1 Tax=Mangrovimonas spongiae TaxID=2494697 RepID=A0A428K5C0_9FLAO|nr:head GIN domain-containing protein [Mangrovimonas spongiae]RSK41552.1 DUF2807 domain-containing protein [Mangrovimonas spongiae]